MIRKGCRHLSIFIGLVEFVVINCLCCKSTLACNLSNMSRPIRPSKTYRTCKYKTWTWFAHQILRMLVLSKSNNSQCAIQISYSNSFEVWGLFICIYVKSSTFILNWYARAIIHNRIGHFHMKNYRLPLRASWKQFPQHALLLSNS